VNITSQKSLLSYIKTDNERTFQRTLTHFIFAVNVRNNYDLFLKNIV